MCIRDRTRSDVAELTFMMAPPDRARMTGSTACIPTSGATTLSSKTARRSAGSSSSRGDVEALSGVVDEDIDPAIRVDGLGDQPLDLSRDCLLYTSPSPRD